MIPVTYPSSLSYRTTRQMVAYPITDLTGKRRWTDYIPVKFVDQTTFTVENSHNNNAYISVDMLSSNANLKEGIDYIPVYIDDAATDAWQVSATGYIPVGYSGAALSLQFAGSTFLDSRITFTRASSGTYFDNTGVLRRANRNLLTYSEQFDNAAWTKARASITANTTVAPDGTMTADKLVEDTTASNTHLVVSNAPTFSSGTTYTVTIFAKAAERSNFAIQVGTGSEAFGALVPFSYFNLSNGTATGTLSATASISSVGNGWYRCVLVTTSATASLATAIRIKLADSTPADSYTGDGTSGIYIWGAQLEEGSTATQYAKTVASTSGAPRFDHDPVTKAPRGLLIEEQRTNLLLRSEEFNDAAWFKDSSTVTANSTVAPDGSTTADTLVSTITGGTNNAYADRSTTVSAGQTYTFSVFLKAGTSPVSTLNLYRASPFSQVVGTITWSNLTYSATGADLLASSLTVLPNGWVRATLTMSSGTATNMVSRVYVRDQGSSNVTGETVIVWGAQLEAGSFATSYIPTVAAQVTRSADSASMTGTNFSSWYRADEGTLYAEFVANGLRSASSYPVAIDDGTSNNFIGFGFDSVGSRFSRIDRSGVTQTSLTTGTLTTSTQNKAAVAFAANNAGATYNGGSVGSGASVVVPTVSTLRLGSLSGSSFFAFNGTIRKLAFYPARLANAQLQALTA